MLPRPPRWWGGGCCPSPRTPPSLSAYTLVSIVADSLDQPGLLLADGSNFGRMSFLPPPMTHMSTSGSWTRVQWVQVRHLAHWATAEWHKMCCICVCEDEDDDVDIDHDGDDVAVFFSTNETKTITSKQNSVVLWHTRPCNGFAVLQHVTDWLIYYYYLGFSSRRYEMLVSVCFTCLCNSTHRRLHCIGSFSRYVPIG